MTELAGAAPAQQPDRDCPFCPRLAALREANRAAWPDWHNAPVPSWGPREAPLMVLGMAPGQRGANRTGRPFTGDHAGRLLYATLLKYGLARGTYLERPDDGMELTGCRVTNAVRCVPPANLPEPAEIRACNTFLQGELQGMPRLRVVLALGVLAHDACLRALDLKRSATRFSHGALHPLPGGLLLADSYHVSRYNTSTRRLTTEMFEAVVAAILPRLA
ncbi:uracil-DNA glycosylase [Belnapia rosea]|uniref:Type-5 uracil-DNA glycosylase n=1 Tax=Belnapia rosea TaxID=938405 RepID=A0A1G6K9N5_9PROT|nr:uracil-DNA glycosylase [Belnapia rosea]SDC27026.1 uracil-DNA glycosylase, family 4 [Belnapia rosea]